MDVRLGYFLNLEAGEENQIKYKNYASISYLSSNKKKFYKYDIMETIKNIGKELNKYGVNFLWINTIDNKIFKGYDKNGNILNHLEIYSNSDMTILIPNLLYKNYEIIPQIKNMLERQWCIAEIIVSRNVYIWDGKNINHWSYYKDIKINNSLTLLNNIKKSLNLKDDVSNIIKNSKSNFNMEDEIIKSILYILQN